MEAIIVFLGSLFGIIIALAIPVLFVLLIIFGIRGFVNKDFKVFKILLLIFLLCLLGVALLFYKYFTSS